MKYNIRTGIRNTCPGGPCIPIEPSMPSRPGSPLRPGGYIIMKKKKIKDNCNQLNKYTRKTIKCINKKVKKRKTDQERTNVRKR